MNERFWKEVDNPSRTSGVVFFSSLAVMMGATAFFTAEILDRKEKERAAAQAEPPLVKKAPALPKASEKEETQIDARSPIEALRDYIEEGKEDILREVFTLSFPGDTFEIAPDTFSYTSVRSDIIQMRLEIRPKRKLRNRESNDEYGPDPEQYWDTDKGQWMDVTHVPFGIIMHLDETGTLASFEVHRGETTSSKEPIKDALSGHLAASGYAERLRTYIPPPPDRTPAIDFGPDSQSRLTRPMSLEPSQPPPPEPEPRKEMTPDFTDPKSYLPTFPKE